MTRTAGPPLRKEGGLTSALRVFAPDGAFGFKASQIESIRPGLRHLQHEYVGQLGTNSAYPVRESLVRLDIQAGGGGDNCRRRHQ